MKVLVTGCAGFIGSNLTEELLRRGYSVAGVDDFSTGRKENIEGIDFEFFGGSINNRELLLEILKDVDVVLHEAAIPSVLRSVKNPMSTNHANINGTLNLLACARDSGVKRVVYASSGSVYGENESIPKREDMAPNPVSPYALTKLTGEIYCRLFTEIYDLETISLRYFNVFGPRQNPDSQYSAVIPRFIKLMLKGKRPTIYGNGEQTRDFSHVENIIEANVMAMKAPRKSCGKAYNIACGERVSLNHLIEEINKILHTNINPKYTEDRLGDVKHSQADISLARKYLGYEPEVYFKEGLLKTIQWYKSY